jgi:hypothetical protein
MTAEERAYLDMVDVTIATCEAHRSAWQTFAAFATPYLRLLQLRQEATDAIGLQSTSSKAATASKLALRESLSARLLRLSDCLVFYFTRTAPNTASAGTARHTKSGLRQMDGATLIGTADELLLLAPGADRTPPTPPAELVTLGITADFITALKQNLEDFTKAKGVPRHLRQESARGGKDLDAVIDNIHDLFDTDLDPAVRVMQYSQAAFATEYFGSRKIVDPGYRTRPLTVRISSSTTGERLSGVAATFTPEIAGGVKTTGPAGEFYVEKMEGGTYQMSLSMPGYGVKQVPVNIVDGQHIEVQETLTPA